MHLIYIIIGDGPYKEKLEFLIIQFKLEKNILVLDKISDEKLKVYYNLADLFVMPSRDIKGDVEGFGIVYLEANSFGLPVIAGRSGGVMEAVLDNETGLLVDPENEEDVYTKIVEVFTNQELYNKLSVNGKIRAEKEFRWDIQVEKLKRRINGK